MVTDTFMLAVHPGEILKEELEERGVSRSDLAREIGVPPNRIGQIIAGKRSITGDTALRLGRWFDMDPQFWLNLQSQYDLAVARKSAPEYGDARPGAKPPGMRLSIAEKPDANYSTDPPATT